METEKAGGLAHVLAIPYPSQGHLNPMLQFCRRLSTKGVKTSLAITNYISNTLKPNSDGHVHLVTISDGYDKGGFSEAESVDAYIAHLEEKGSRSLMNVIQDHVGTSQPITCLLYDAFLPWALEVAKKLGLHGAAFFTQACSVNYIYYLFHHRRLALPVTSPPVSIPGLPPLEMDDLPSFVGAANPYPAYLELVLSQNSNLDKADFVIVNTFYELEIKVVDEMSKECPLLTIGPTVPSFYLDKQIDFDKDYGLNLYHLDSTPIKNWLSTKPPKSVVYVSFGSMACLSREQMEALAMGLKESGCNFLWVVRSCEEDKLPKGFTEDIGDKGLVVTWSPQLEVLANEATGCFFTHCGWNSTLEALSLGVPMICMPQWTDQPTDAKLIEDVWKVGVRVRVDEKGLVRREEIVACINEIMVGKKRGEIAENAQRWKNLAKEAVSEGGSSQKCVDHFVLNVLKSSY